MRAQKEALRPLSAFDVGLGAGAFSFEPVAALYLARPLAVSPAPLDTGNFSPLPTDSDTDFFLAMGLSCSLAASVSMHRLQSPHSYSYIIGTWLFCYKIAQAIDEMIATHDTETAISFNKRPDIIARHCQDIGVFSAVCFKHCAIHVSVSIYMILHWLVGFDPFMIGHAASLI